MEAKGIPASRATAHIDIGSIKPSHTMLICSLPIHYPQCTKKVSSPFPSPQPFAVFSTSFRSPRSCRIAAQWLDQEALKPAHERRPLPVLSSDLEAALAGERAMPMSTKAISDFNSQMTQKYVQESLHHCSICGRSFK